MKLKATPKTWTATTVSVADMNTEIRDQLNYIGHEYQLSKWYADIPNGAGPVTLLTVTVTGDNKRSFRVEFFAWSLSGTTGEVFDFRILRNGTQIALSRVEIASANVNRIHVVAYDLPPAGAITYSVTHTRVTGSHNGTVKGAADIPITLAAVPL